MIAAPASAAQTIVHPRERLSLDAGWRFQRGDPPGIDGQLDYEVRPLVQDPEDGKAADARPQAAIVTGAQPATLRAWILPSANALIREPADRHVRPAGNPGGHLPIVQHDYDDSTWQQVDLPHDWAIAGPFLVEGPYGGMGRLPSWGVGWYRRSIDVPASDRGRRIALEIDGAMSYAAVWCNGRLVGGWPYGYSSWQVDLTDCLRYGLPNQLAIRLDNPPDSARWYPGGGLYRHVWLRKTSAMQVDHWGVQIDTPQVSTASAQVRVRTTVRNDGATQRTVQAATQLYALDARGQATGQVLAAGEPMSARVAADATTLFDQTLVLAHPRLWGPPPTQAPHRYLAVTRLQVDGRVVDEVRTPFGVREVRFDPDRGLLVNGEHVPIRGVNNHHDLGALGAAFDAQAAERQLRLLQEMGANAVRMSHNPPAPELLDITDRLGLLVVDEIFDSWQMKKTPLDFHRVFDDWREPDLRAMLRRDRNHPSIILWSIGNEVGEQYSGDDGAAIARQLRDIVRQEDPARPVTAALNYAKPGMPLPNELDVIGLNYQGEGIRDTPQFEGTERIRTPPMYAAFHQRYPDKAILSTETASTLSSRGFYAFPVAPDASAPVRDGHGGDPSTRQVSAYELYAVDFGASPDKVFAALDAHPFVAGEFVWTGFDYLGEPTPYYRSRSSYSGIVDLAGFAKDRYYLYQSRWRPEQPVAHLLPHWTWPGREGQVTPVHVFTSGDEAELFVNGVSQGRQHKAPGQYRLRWDQVVYQPGELRVQTWRAGRPWASEAVQTAGPASRIELTAEAQVGDGPLAFVQARIVDAQGRTVPAAHPPIRFQARAGAVLVATDNGDPTDMTAFPSATRAAFGGRALAIVRRDARATGSIYLHAEADGLAAADLLLTPVPPATGATP
ncbi:MAG TPA: beta-galactosidase GalB [Stenotrophomonas sp.]|jgi:beta-galactosidase